MQILFANIPVCHMRCLEINIKKLPTFLSYLFLKNVLYNISSHMLYQKFLYTIHKNVVRFWHIYKLNRYDILWQKFQHVKFKKFCKFLAHLQIRLF